MNAVTESVLVVEDDAALREALIDTLCAAGIAAIPACDAAAALPLLETEEIALVISDVQMPGLNGYQLLTCIKRLRPDVPVVLMTAYGTVAQAVSAMREGATDYIVKPFDAQALIETARRQLAARPRPPCSSPGRAARARRSMPASCATLRPAPTSRSSPSTALRYLKTCSKQHCSATRRARSPAPRRRTPASSNRHRVARCCSTRSPKWTWDCRRRSCAFCRSARWSAWGARAPSRSTCV